MATENGETESRVVRGHVTHAEADARAIMAVIGECYAHAHGYVSLIVCLVSILMNLATVVVLTRRQMLSPSNTLLTGIAVTETIKLAIYGVYAYEFNLVTQIDSDVAYPIGWIYYLLVHASLSLVLYAVVTWLTVLLAIFRYIVVCVQHGQQIVTVRVARVTVLCVYLFCTLVYIPSYIALYPVPKMESVEETETLQNKSTDSVSDSDLGLIGEGRTLLISQDEHFEFVLPALNLTDKNNQSDALHEQLHIGYTYDVHANLYSAIKIIHGPVMKLLASVLITVPTALLIVKMQQAAKKRIILKGSARQKSEENTPTRRTVRQRISSAATVISTIPGRIGYSLRRSNHSPLNSSCDTRRIRVDCAIVVMPPSEMQNSGSRSEQLSNNSHADMPHSHSESSALPSRSIVSEDKTTPKSNRLSRSNRSRNASQKSSQEHHRRTTVLLLAVVIGFVVVEFPHGVMLLVGELAEGFYENVYAQLGDLLDLVTLLSSSLNFILYCTMSRQFRSTFKETFATPLLRLQPCLFCRKHQQQQNGAEAAPIGGSVRRSNSHKPSESEQQLRQTQQVQKEQDKEPKEAQLRPQLLSVESACLALPSQVSEISVSVFSGASSASRTSQFSGLSHLSACSAVSNNSHLSVRSNSTATSNTTCTTSDSLQLL